MRYTHRQMVEAVVNFFVAVAVGLLALRVVLRFFNGNPDASFVNWVYTSTNTLLEPFRGIFTSSGAVDRGWVIDYTALFAMAVYALAGYLVLSVAEFWARRK
jgi:uncharacterized protein YggT (Ycf19 family)